ncbi:hypothetical protein ACJJTC_007810 [Scirpophaga incertulas]
MDKPGPSKKRKVKDENRQFQEIWTEKYFFVWSHNKVVCLICKNSVAIAKEHNVKRHYETQHPTFTRFTGELRKQIMLSLKRELIGQQAMFTKPIQDSEAATRIENAPESMQLKIIDIQNDQDLRNKFNEGDLLNFYRCIDKNTYKELRINALKCASLFGSTYIYEQTFSILNNNKTKNRNRLANESLEAVLRVATSKFESNIKKIVSTMQCHASN